MSKCVLRIDGVDMPPPARSGVTFKREKHATTYRSSTGKLFVSGLYISTVVSITWPHLTPAQYAVIENAVGGDALKTLEITYFTGEVKTMQVRIGDLSATWYSYASGLQYISGCTVTAEESLESEE